MCFPSEPTPASAALRLTKHRSQHTGQKQSGVAQRWWLYQCFLGWFFYWEWWETHWFWLSWGIPILVDAHHAPLPTSSSWTWALLTSPFCSSASPSRPPSTPCQSGSSVPSFASGFTTWPWQQCWSASLLWWLCLWIDTFLWSMPSVHSASAATATLLSAWASFGCCLYSLPSLWLSTRPSWVVISTHPTAPSAGSTGQMVQQPSRCTRLPPCWWDTSCPWFSSPAAMPRWVRGTLVMFKWRERSLPDSWWLGCVHSNYPANK